MFCLTFYLRDRAKVESSIYHATFELVCRFGRRIIYEIPVLDF
jgi:hypothetical protein